MTKSLWNCSADELLQRASSADPTPGGGSIAAITAAFGFSLVLMAIEVTLAGSDESVSEAGQLVGARTQVRSLQAEAVAAVDRDVVEFDAVMAGYRMPRASEDELVARRAAIEAATVAATDGPLSLVEAAVAGIELTTGIEPLVKATIVSDAQAGRDLLRGAALAALRTADINLIALEKSGHVEATELRRRRNAASDAVTGLEGHR